MNRVTQATLTYTAAAILTCSMPQILAPTAHALALPVFEELESKWAQVAVGMPLDEVIKKMGAAPKTHEQSDLVGVKLDELSWTDIRLTRYKARFVAGHLYAKTLSRGD